MILEPHVRADRGLWETGGKRQAGERGFGLGSLSVSGQRNNFESGKQGLAISGTLPCARDFDHKGNRLCCKGVPVECHQDLAGITLIHMAKQMN